MYSKKLSSMPASATVSVSKKAAELKAEGKDVISFAMGETNYTTPKIITDQLKLAVDSGKNGYTTPNGILELREAVCKRLLDDYDLEYTPEEIVCFAGAKQALYNIFQCILDPEDEVVIFKPYWVTYPAQVTLSEGKPVFADTDADYQVSKKELIEKITPKTKAIVINSPNNPTGAILNEESLKNIAEVAEECDLWIISDEIYDKLIYVEEYPQIIQKFPKIKDRTILVNGLSKNSSVTGWRIGYTACEPVLAKLLTKLNGQTITHPTSVVQHASVTALTYMDDYLPEMVYDLKLKRDIAFEELSKIDNLIVKKPEAAFYLFVGIPEDDLMFCKELISQKFVATTPGTAFGAKNYFRLSFPTSIPQIKEGIERIKEFMAERYN